MPEHLFQTIKKDTNKLKYKNLAIFGVSFKNNTGDCRHTPSKILYDKLKKLKHTNILINDNLVKEKDFIKLFKVKPTNHSQIINKSNIYVFLNGHDIFNEIKEKIFSKKTKCKYLFDGRNFFSNKEIKVLKNLGIKYSGLGRYQ